MTSKRSQEANSRNAQRSTGPRTIEGKARSRLNAHSHGLAASDPNPDLVEEVEQLARAIIGGRTCSTGVLQAARDFAEADLLLRRIRSVKYQLVRDHIARSSDDATDAASTSTAAPSDVPLIGELLKALERIERYERRTFSQRKRASRALPQMPHK